MKSNLQVGVGRQTWTSHKISFLPSLMEEMQHFTSYPYLYSISFTRSLFSLITGVNTLLTESSACLPSTNSAVQADNLHWIV